MTTRSGRKYNSVVAQPQGETADMGETSEAIAAMQELFRNLLDEKKKREVEKEIQRQKEEESEVRPTPIASELAEEVQMEEELPIEVNPELSSLDENLFSGRRPRVKLTRSQKRMNRRQHQQDIPVGALDMLAVELQKLQETDSSLAHVRSMCGTRKPQESESHYFNSEGLLFRRWIQRRGKLESAVEQLVLPTAAGT